MFFIEAQSVPLPDSYFVEKLRSSKQFKTYQAIFLFISNFCAVRDDSYIIRRNEGDPCPVVVAPVNVGGGLNWGHLTNFDTFFRGFSKKTGSYDTRFGGSGGPTNGGTLGVGGWNQIVPNSSKDCQTNQQQKSQTNPFSNS